MSPGFSVKGQITKRLLKMFGKNNPVWTPKRTQAAPSETLVEGRDYIGEAAGGGKNRRKKK